MKTSQITAKRFRFVLVAVLLLVVAGLVGGSLFAQLELRSYSDEISAQYSQAARSESDIATLRKIETFLRENSTVEATAQRVVGESKSYQYQDQIITDLSSIARESNISITSFTFAEGNAGGDAAAAPTTTAPTTATPAPAAPSGLNSRSISIQIVSPVGYEQLLGFIRRIEQNTTQMQVSGVSMSRDESGADQVSSNTFEIKVYVR